MKIKQKYVSLKSGINEKKLSRILNSEQEVDGDDMEKIAAVLGHKAEYFFLQMILKPRFMRILIPENLHFMTMRQPKSKMNLQ